MEKVSTDRDGWAVWTADLVTGAPRREGSVRIVAVEGRSGSGKSTVAERLRAALVARGEPAAVLTMEDLYPGWAGLSRASELLREWILLPLAEGRPVVWRRYDWERGGFGPPIPGPPEEVAGGGTLVVEGCGSGTGVVGDLVDVLLWVEAPTSERERRLAAREDSDLYAPYRGMWARQEEDVYAVDPPRDRADLVVLNR
ncbi:uridine kinase family protein [Nocardiopsis alba]|uniref:uridine kinase family protein n=1 Tax=Nocardiopsis alba TaxID=53437 RepID=UPI00034C9A34|nr:phosphoribulokinase [Nocardiopsis alba]